jgi:hypothetical protein
MFSNCLVYFPLYSVAYVGCTRGTASLSALSHHTGVSECNAHCSGCHLALKEILMTALTSRALAGIGCLLALSGEALKNASWRTASGTFTHPIKFSMSLMLRNQTFLVASFYFGCIPAVNMTALLSLRRRQQHDLKIPFQEHALDPM